jgi:3-hydroxy-9,10-secoandrosta-1,3,5(10)-triene-9,17-dione monooxygenase
MLDADPISTPIELDPRIADFAMGDFTKSEYVARARALVPVLRERSQEQWGVNRLMDKTAALMHEAGIFRMLQPKRFGGGETSPIEWLETISTLAEGDPSVAWTTGVLGIHSFHLAHFSEQAQQDVWGANEHALLSSPYAPNPVKKVDGGFLVSGVWKFATGVHHCAYAVIGGSVYDRELQPGDDRMRTGDFRAFLVARDQFTIGENWDVSGMRGTGSHDIIVDNVFVPEHRTLPFRHVTMGTTPGRLVNPGILYQLPFWQVLGRITTSPVPLGALKSMADQFCERARSRVNLRGQRTAEDPVATLAVANAYSAIDEIKGNCYRNLGRLMKAVANGGTLPLAERMMFRYQTSSATYRVAELALALFKACGASGIYSDQPYGRLLNDIVAVTGHASNQHQGNANALAGLLMGLSVEQVDPRA